MKLTALLIFIGLLQVSATTRAQLISISEKNIALDVLFKKIQSQTGYTFFFKAAALKNLPKVNVEIENASIADVLDKCFHNKPLEYLIVDKSVVIKRKAGASVTDEEAIANDYVSVTGVVVDEKGDPLPGVSIKIKGKNLAWTTNAKGEFKLLVAEADGTLQFSFVGFKTKDLAIKGLKSPVTIQLEPAVGTLDDVQVLAYGTISKRLNTGDVTTISGKEIEKNPVSNVLQAIQNRVPGMFIQQNTGMVGGSFNVQVRGGSTVNLSAPLFIIDGVQYPAGTQLPQLPGLNRNANQFNGGNALNYINPNDVESISVLKDADATALYGSRGAYGVIIITTKKGKPGDARLQADIFDGVSVRGVTPTLLNTDQYLMIRREAFKNDGATPGPSDLDLNGTWPTDRYTDYKKYYLGSTAQDQNFNLSYSGGNTTTNYLVSGNLRNQGAIEKGGGRDLGGNVRMDLNNTSKDGRFYIDMAATYNMSRNNMTPYDFFSSITSAPNSPQPINPDGSLDWSTGSNGAAAANAQYLNTTSNLISTLTARYKFLDHFTFNTQLGFNVLETKEFRALPTSYFVPSADVNTRTTSSINNFRYRTMTIDPNFQYQNVFFKKLKFEGRVGVTLQDRKDYQITLTGTNFSSDVLLSSPSSASNPVTSLYNATSNRYGGAFVTTSLNWDDKYLVNINGRRDGSTSFGPGNRFGNFGSVAAAWIVSQEPWMKPLAPVMNFLKLRGSYGTVGGDQIASYAYLNTYKVDALPYAGSIGLSPIRIANPDLHWESKKSEEAGVTMQFLNGRIELDGSYYRNWTSNALVNESISQLTGFAVVAMNKPDAKLLSWGYEGMVTTINIQSKGFSWKTTLNFSSPHSKLVSYPGLANYNSTSLTNINYALGKPITGIRLFNYGGVNPQTGNYKFTNAAGAKADFAIFGNGSLNDLTDRTEYIDLAPKYYGGMNNSFTYKHFNVDVFMSLTRRNALNFYAQQAALLWPGAFNANPTTTVLGRWQNPGDITNVPKVSQSIITYFSQNAFKKSTGAYSDVTFLRISNINISYDFNGEWLKKANIKRLGVYLRGQNLWTFSKYKDLDPENMDANSIGPLRVFVAGFNVTL